MILIRRKGAWTMHWASWAPYPADTGLWRSGRWWPICNRRRVEDSWEFVDDDEPTFGLCSRCRTLIVRAADEQGEMGGLK